MGTTFLVAIRLLFIFFFFRFFSQFFFSSEFRTCSEAKDELDPEHGFFWRSPHLPSPSVKVTMSLRVKRAAPPSHSKSREKSKNSHAKRKSEECGKRYGENRRMYTKRCNAAE